LPRRISRARAGAAAGDPVLWAVLALLVAASFAVFAAQALDAAAHDRVFIGADGLWAQDQLQYLGWATDAGRHGLIADLFALRLGGRVFLDPVALISGLAHVRLGLSYALVQAIWKLIAAAVLFAALVAYARSLLGGRGQAVAVAAALALFMLPPSYLIARALPLYGVRVTGLETLPVFWLWGYYPIALAVTAMIACLIQVDRALERGGGMLAAGALGLATAWLHPWQGATLLTILAGLVVWERPSWARHRRLLGPALATAAPLAYYAVLPYADAGWAQARTHTEHNWFSSGDLAILIVVLPVALLGLPGYLKPAATSRERMLKLWPLAIVVVFLVVRTDRFHPLGGWSIPAALCVVRGWPWVRERIGAWPPLRARGGAAPLAAVAGIAFLLAAAPIEIAYHVADFRAGPLAASELDRDDARALARVASLPGSGGVLTTAYVGHWVPALTDHPSWIGHPTWTPDYSRRDDEVDALFGAADGPAAARRFVATTGAAFVLEPCGYPARLRAALTPARFRALRVGCATLFWRP